MTVAIRVIPCLDVDAGRVVKGVNFAGLRDAGDPVGLAAAYDRAGADELTFLDITASSDERETMYEAVSRTAEQVFIPLTVGGGVRSTQDVDRLLRAGADKVALNTAAVARPALLREAALRFGAQCVVLSVDADGTRRGFDVELIAAVRREVAVPVIASGGAGEPAHFSAAVAAGADAVLAASLFHFGELTIGEVKSELAAAGYTVRPVPSMKGMPDAD